MHDTAVGDVELGAVAGTGNNVLLQLAFRQIAAEVGTGASKGVNAIVMLDQDHPVAV
jgi:hypothetical protein